MLGIKNSHHCIKHRGFALIYTLWASIALIVFFTGLIYLQSGTLKAVRFDEKLVRAKALADFGNELCFNLLSEAGLDWVDSFPFSFSNDPEASDYLRGLPSDADFRASISADKIGGYFRVRVLPSDQVGGIDVPGAGTFWVLDAEGRVEEASFQNGASSRYLVKMGVPFLNNLYVARGTTQFDHGSKLKGPIFIDHSSGADNASLNFLGHISHWAYGPTRSVLRAQSPNVEGIFRSQGTIKIVNENWGGPTLMNPVGAPPGEQILNPGTYAAGTTIAMPPPPVRSPIEYSGGVSTSQLTFTGESTLDTNVPLGILRSTIDQALGSLKDAPTTININVTSHTSGVLIELKDSNVVISKAKLEKRGELFDIALLAQDVAQEAQGRYAMVNWARGHYGSTTAGIEALAKECAWDDPGFDNKSIPPALIAAASVHIDPSLIPPVGDYLDINQVVPDGPPLQTIPIDRSRWTTIRLYADALNAESDNVGEVVSGTVDASAPVVFVQGRVEGKLVLAYDLEGSAALADDLESEHCRANILVVTDPSPSGVPAGITLKDDRPKLEPDATGSFSEDHILLISRGRVKPWGMPIRFASMVVDTSGNMLDLFTPRLGSPTSPEAERYGSYHPLIDTELQGITVGRHIHLSEHRFTNAGKPAPQDWVFEAGGYEGRAWEHWTWSELRTRFGATRPIEPSLMGGLMARIPIEMRACNASPILRWNTEGAHSSLGSNDPAPVYGNQVYDYRWRSLDAETLKQELGLPVTPMLLDRRGQ